MLNPAKNVALIVLGAVAIAASSIFLTLLVSSYNSKGRSVFWKFDPTPVHNDQVELSLEESARPDKQFIEMVLPYERNLLAIAQKAEKEAHSDQVKNLAKTVIATQEQIQIKRGDKESGQTVTQSYALKSSDKVKNDLDKLYKDLYKVELDPSRLGLSPEQTQINLQTSQNTEDVDREFISQMVHNERIAVKLAYLVVDNAQGSAIRDLAENIIKRQGAEVTTLHDALADLKPEFRSTVTQTNSNSKTIRQPATPTTANSH